MTAGRAYLENVSSVALTVRVDDDQLTLQPGAVSSWPEVHRLAEWLLDNSDAIHADARLSLKFDPTIIGGGQYMPGLPTAPSDIVGVVIET